MLGLQMSHSAQAQTQMSPFVIAVANRKGGTGKTTSAVNLAVCFARRGLKTLLIDFDTQGHAGLGFGIVARKGEPTAHDVFSKGHEALAEAIRPTREINLDLAPADLQLSHPGNEARASSLAEAIRALPAHHAYDLVLIDTPPSLDALLVTALASANGVIIPFVPHPLAAEGVKQFARLLFQVRLSNNPELKFVALFPTQVLANILLHQRTIDHIRSQFGTERIMSPIRPDIKLAEAFEVRRSVFEHAAKSRGAHDYRELADRVGALWKQNVASELQAAVPLAYSTCALPGP